MEQTREMVSSSEYEEQLHGSAFQPGSACGKHGSPEVERALQVRAGVGEILRAGNPRGCTEHTSG